MAEWWRCWKRTVKRLNRDTSHKKNWTGEKTENSRAQWERFNAAEVRVVKGGEAIATPVQGKWQMSSGGWFPAVGNSKITAELLLLFFFYRLTCDHGPVAHTGGQLCVLQACSLARAGWTHWASDRSATPVWLVLWTHWTDLVCSPPPQLRLHAPHSPTDQLGWHNINRLSQQAAS